MKKYLKPTSIILSCVSLLFIMAIFTSCKKDFLDRNLQGQYTIDTYPYPQGSGPFDQFVFGAYAALRQDGCTGFPFIGTVSIRSDDADKGSVPSDSPPQNEMDKFPVLPTNYLTNSLWVDHFNVIARANDAIKRVKADSTASNQPFRAQAEGEARFLRAYSYFMLVRSFGAVPKIDTATSVPKNLPRTPVSEIYSFIETDLQFASANLPSSYPVTFQGRLTSGAANGMLAKVYLTRQNWAMAMASANAVINSGIYDLSQNFTDIFKETGENGKESLFEVQAIATPTEQANRNYGVSYARDQGVRGGFGSPFNFGFGFNVPNTNLEGAFEANDPRKERTFLRQGESTYYGETLPAALPNPAYNEKVYTNPAVRQQVGNLGGWWMNVRILRYADVLLMYAEAANEIGGASNIADAVVKLNMVRARARRGAPAGTLPDIASTDQATVRAAIRQERRVELAMEQDRFFDLVRWGIAGPTLNAAGRPNFNPARDQLLPVPQTQIDISAGVLTQNPNY